MAEKVSIELTPEAKRLFDIQDQNSELTLATEELHRFKYTLNLQPGDIIKPATLSKTESHLSKDDWYLVTDLLKIKSEDRIRIILVPHKQQIGYMKHFDIEGKPYDKWRYRVLS